MDGKVESYEVTLVVDGEGRLLKWPRSAGADVILNENSLEKPQSLEGFKVLLRSPDFRGADPPSCQIINGRLICT